MDEFRIDSHKLMYHVERVNQWLKGVDIYPVYIEISPIGACNHRCTYCALDYMEYNPRSLDTQILKKRLTEMGSLGVKSIMYAGEGEPLLHKDISEIINHTKKSGIDAAVTSNGVLFTDKVFEACLESITWIKISINAACPETYSKIHRTKEEDFGKVIDNISKAVKFRESRRLASTIGMQMILLPENVNEAVSLAKKAKEIGADYLVIKSYSQHFKSITKKYADFKYGNYLTLNEELKKVSDKNFKVIFRENAMKKLEEGRAYKRCMALPFWSYIDSGGGLWGCSAFLNDERFLFGNINENTFEEVWKGERRKKVMEFVGKGLDIKECRKNCRMDEVNRYLWELRNPSLHVNFI
ncbi:MAG: radical SAM protein [Deltaproteobacteria bacterium]|nr:radical SAM protein [Deltaproteobacteria bacterium]